MSTASVFGAFNARWKTPEEVARTFVPIPQVARLVQTQHSLLMGPRGCGKTTLLKMLTKPAQDQWRNERCRLEPQLRDCFDRPDFVAIYIPSDVRWSFELRELDQCLKDCDHILSTRVQRCLVAITAVTEALNTFDYLLMNNGPVARNVALALIDHFGFEDVVPGLGQVRLHLERLATDIRRLLTKRDGAALEMLLEKFPSSFTSHALDPLITACSVYNESVTRSLRPDRWGLCFDELEIAPLWLQADLIRSYRSTNQKFLLKCTWSPVLPRDMPVMMSVGNDAGPSHSQEQGSDFAAIRIWHSHIDDAKGFCRDFSTRLIRDKLRLPNVTPEEVFGRSLFAQADRPDQNKDLYGKESEVWTAMVELGKRDRSFREYLIDNGIDPANPVSDDVKQRDECLRKVKPIVLLRETFWKTGKSRSRKRPALYAGEDSIYAMSDGNPRWLAGLLNDLLDLRTSVPDFDKTHFIPLTLQTPVLRAASDRMKSYIKDYPRGPISPNKNRITLFTLVEEAAEFFRMQVLGENFQGDPIGSFTVDEKTDDTLLEEIHLGLLNGALIYVGSSQYDVAHELRNSRIRLSFMLMPNYRLLFRNYRAVNLSNILQRTDSRQLGFFGESQEDPA